MKKLTGLFAGFCVVVTGLGVAAAQEPMGPPKVLVIQREFLKPGRGGAGHERSESAFVRAMVAAKWPTHYFAVEAMSGPTRALFLTGYPSFAAWEKEGYEKVPSAKWALFESVYGVDNGGMYLVFNPMKSLAEVEEGYADQKKFVEALGEDKMKKLGELTASCIESQQTNLFRFNPKMSYPLDSWIKEDPTFWKPKMTAPAKAEKPAQ